MKRWSLSHAFLPLTVALAVAGCREDARHADILGARMAASGTPIEFTQAFGMPVRAITFADVSGCDNSPGPYITLAGEITLGGLGSRLIFRNNEKGTHEYSDESQTDLVVVPTGDRVVLPKQPVQGGVGGNPFIWIKFEDDRAHPYRTRSTWGAASRDSAPALPPTTRRSPRRSPGCLWRTAPTVRDRRSRSTGT